MSKKKLLICGLPSSGKTTFFAALWHLLSTDEVPITLTLSRLPENREYLQKLSAKWSRFIEVDRTPTEEIKEIQLLLKNGCGEEVEIFAPDMSGETWESLWTDRSCASRVAEWAKDASGIMLFLHADKIEQPVDIATLCSMAGDSTADSSQNNDWVAAEAPTQVILVDILQSLSCAPLCHKARNVVIFISAWDKVAEMGLSPDDFLSSHMSLLHQYLKCSGDYLQYKIFGVSALGGDLNLPAESDRIKAEDIPSKRIKVVQGAVGALEHEHDLTLPIKWLLESQGD